MDMEGETQIEPTLKDLTRILKPFVEAEVGETGDYPELDEVLRSVVSWKVLVENKIQEKIDKDKKRMGGELAYYFDIREFVG